MYSCPMASEICKLVCRAVRKSSDAISYIGVPDLDGDLNARYHDYFVLCTAIKVKKCFYLN